jgi:hypothetical protein
MQTARVLILLSTGSEVVSDHFPGLTQDTRPRPTAQYQLACACKDDLDVLGVEEH